MFIGQLNINNKEEILKAYDTLPEAIQDLNNYIDASAYNQITQALIFEGQNYYDKQLIASLRIIK